MYFQGLAWVSTKFTNRSLDFPDIEFHFVSGSPGSDGGRQIRKVIMIDIKNGETKQYKIFYEQKMFNDV